MKCKVVFFFFFIGFAAFSALGQNPAEPIKLLTQKTDFSIRGLSVVNDSVLWVSGTNGTVGVSVDSGQNWIWNKVAGADSLDFRSMYAFDNQSAIIANAGSPATIWRTDDQGRHWEKVFEKEDERYFLDGVTFWNKKQGLVYGDPVNSRFVILRTKDGGRHWEMLPFHKRPVAKNGEASFAASGTAVFSLPSGYTWIGTGGAVARVLISENYGETWEAITTPMLQGESSTGIFSLAFLAKNHGIIVGGNYKKAASRQHNAFLTKNGGKDWDKPVVSPLGYRSCVIYITSDTLVATGKTGTDVSFDGGNTWKSLSSTGFYVVQKARFGTAVYLAGSEGRIARLTGFPQNEQPEFTIIP